MYSKTKSQTNSLKKHVILHFVLTYSLWSTPPNTNANTHTHFCLSLSPSLTLFCPFCLVSHQLSSSTPDFFSKSPNLICSYISLSPCPLHIFLLPLYFPLLSQLVINGFNLERGRTLVPKGTFPLPPVSICVCQSVRKKKRTTPCLSLCNCVAIILCLL